MKQLNTLFVYGIFLDESNRTAFGMTHPRYACVKDYATFGGGIVRALKIEDSGLSLSGLLVDVNPTFWKSIDQLETGYTRIVVKTITGLETFMYVGGLHANSSQRRSS